MKYIKKIIKFTLIFHFNSSFAPYFLDFEKVKFQAQQTINYNGNSYNEFIRMIAIDFDPNNADNGAHLLFSAYFDINSFSNNQKITDTKKVIKYKFTKPTTNNKIIKDTELSIENFSLAYINGIIEFSTDSANVFWRTGTRNQDMVNNSKFYHFTQRGAELANTNAKDTSEIKAIFEKLSLKNYPLTAENIPSKIKCASPKIKESNFLIYINNALYKYNEKTWLSAQKGAVGESICDMIILACNNATIIHQGKEKTKDGFGGHWLDSVYELPNGEVIMIEVKGTSGSENTYSQCTENFTKINKMKKNTFEIYENLLASTIDLIKKAIRANKLSSGAVFILDTCFIDSELMTNDQENFPLRLMGIYRNKLLNQALETFKTEANKYDEKDIVIKAVKKAFENNNTLLVAKPSPAAYGGPEANDNTPKELLNRINELKNTFGITQQEITDQIEEMFYKKNNKSTQTERSNEEQTNNIKNKDEALMQIQLLMQKFGISNEELTTASNSNKEAASEETSTPKANK